MSDEKPMGQVIQIDEARICSIAASSRPRQNSGSAPRKYQALPAIAMSATIPAPSSTNIERCFGTGGLVGFASARLADFERIDPNRLGDVLELDRAQIAHGEIEPRLHLPIRLLGQTEVAAGSAIPSNRAAILTQCPIRSPSLSSTTSPRWMPTRNSMRRSGGKPSIALDHAILNLDGAADKIDNAAKLNDAAVAGALHHAAMMHGNGRRDQIAPERTQPRKRPLLVGSGKLAVSDDICCKNGCELPGLGHGSPLTTRQNSTVAGPRQVASPRRSLLQRHIRTPTWTIGRWLRSRGLE